MNLSCTIDVTLACAGWTWLCPRAESLARVAAELALVRGTIALGLAWLGTVELGITLADAAGQQRLNRDYRGLDRPTNVLAFPVWESGTRHPPGAPVLLGDVVLAMETVAQEAAEQEKPIGDHLVHLTVHGVLHLLGYDHLTQVEAATMEALERSILSELGLPDPYEDPLSSISPAAV